MLYSRPGQPSQLRAAAVQALSKQAKDDPQAEKLLIALVDDPVQSVRTSAMFAVTSGGFTSAVPALERQLPKINGPHAAASQGSNREPEERHENRDGRDRFDAPKNRRPRTSGRRPRAPGKGTAQPRRGPQTQGRKGQTCDVQADELIAQNESQIVIHA